MPELVNLLVPVSSLAKGDTTDWGTVDKIDRKVKWSYVTMVETGQTKRLESDAAVRVLRLQPTQAEKDAQLLDAKLQMVDRRERGVQEQLADVQAKAASELAKGWHLGYSRLDDLLQAQADAAVWDKITHVSQVQATRAVSFDSETGTWSVRDDAEVAAENDGSPALTRLQVVEYIQDKVRTELVERARFTSRSTSLASNLLEDYEREAQAKFASRALGWF
jgi:hypothetical protein